ncbi:helix-turn-helix domain-containing protein [Pseudactinotalea sp.]
MSLDNIHRLADALRCAPGDLF